MRLKTQVGAYLQRNGVPLNARGRAALDAGALPTLAASSQQTPDAAALLATRELDVMILDRYLTLDDAWAHRFKRYAELQHESDQRTVALFVRPISNA